MEIKKALKIFKEVGVISFVLVMIYTLCVVPVVVDEPSIFIRVIEIALGVFIISYAVCELHKEMKKRLDSLRNY